MGGIGIELIVARSAVKFYIQRVGFERIVTAIAVGYTRTIN